MSPLEVRRRHVEEARRAFTRAAAALTEWPDGNALAFALLESAIGLHELAQADRGDVARARVMDQLRAERTRRERPR
jgi:hypothetical protein